MNTVKLMLWFLWFILLTDKDECKLPNICDFHANCTNTEGSFFCTCNQGFLGDGHDCRGMIKNIKNNNIILEFAMFAIPSFFVSK